MKILAYTLIVLGPVIMALSRPFTDNLNAPLMCLGAALGIVGIFMRSRIREGIPILKVTDKDKTQLREMRRVFSLRRIVGRFLGAFGALFLFVAISAPFVSKGERYDWRVSVVGFVIGLVLVLCATPLLRKSGR